jgi:hypothetical protein
MFHKMLGNSWVTAQLAPSQGEFSSMELVNLPTNYSVATNHSTLTPNFLQIYLSVFIRLKQQIQHWDSLN